VADYSEAYYRRGRVMMVLGVCWPRVRIPPGTGFTHTPLLPGDHQVAAQG
jgi:hypothetical protein